jgi:hypothetical protein
MKCDSRQQSIRYEKEKGEVEREEPKREGRGQVKRFE